MFARYGLLVAKEGPLKEGEMMRNKGIWFCHKERIPGQ
jgi:hypothetical protein